MQKKLGLRLSILAVGLILVGAGCAPAPQTGKRVAEDNTAGSQVPVTQQMPAELGNTNVKEMVVEAEATTAPVKEFVMTAKNWEFSPSIITVNKGDKVKLTITSVDVKHGFKLPDFNIKVDLEPNKTEIIEFVADKVGTFTFSCSVLCGEGHRQMTGQLIVK